MYTHLTPFLPIYFYKVVCKSANLQKCPQTLYWSTLQICKTFVEMFFCRKLMLF